MDELSIKIQNATMELIMEKGYAFATTKEIAKLAGVNECTIFRKFGEKKEIVLQAMQQKEWHPDLEPEDFMDCQWDLEKDLHTFSKIYMSKVTSRFVRLSIGLRTPELAEYTAAGIMNIPKTFKEGVKQYFDEMIRKGYMDQEKDTEALAMTFLSMNFGFVFLKASFEDRLSLLTQEEYRRVSIAAFVNGIKK
ncbi:TetR/AcrR family transcriptional regulator [Anaerosporobacter faecicola]|uniref:TetR/AcrR family transcriptional regulator n=1 Tax=Anaerosporobacter faecicola TaxID=2718714 RepID=UPI00143BCCCA